MREILYKDLSDSMNLQMPDLMEVTTKEQLVQVCRDVNLKGRSGNNFKTGDKLEKFNCEEGILLINGVECDPGLVHDGWIYRNHLSKVNEGARILNNIFHFKKIILATKEPLKKKETIFEQVKIKDRFPMGYEKFIDSSINSMAKMFETLIEMGYMKKGTPEVYAMELYAPFFMYHTIGGESEKIVNYLEEHVRKFREDVVTDICYLDRK